MKPGSLRLRMMLLAVLWVAVSLITAAIALQYLFSVNIERTMRADMAAALGRLVAVIEADAEVPAISTPLPDPRYSVPLSGKYWQITALDNGETARSRSLWDYVIMPPDLPPGGEAIHHQKGPDGGHLLLLTRHIEIEDGTIKRQYLVTIGEDHAPIDAAITSFNESAILVLSLVGVIMIFAAWLQIRLGLAPVNRVHRDIEAIRRGAGDRLEGDYASELRPLVDEVNTLLEAREASTEKARSRAADLAHGLKTPLAALHGVADRLRDKGNDADADLLDELSTEMSERIDHQLRLAALRIRTSAHAASASLNTAVLRTLTVLKKTSRGESLHWIAELGDDCAVDMHRQDLLELIGITLENAAKWAETRVTLRSSRSESYAFLEICDDGPGIPEAQLAELGVRGRRLDQSRPGTGLGLAMATEILDLNGGTIRFGRADSGGLMVTLALPRSGATPPSAS